LKIDESKIEKISNNIFHGVVVDVVVFVYYVDAFLVA
jgi:hypothetical protein